MSVGISIAGAILIIAVLWEAFETVIFPRRVARRLRMARIFYRLSWRAWKAVVDLLPAWRVKESLYSIYGPLSLIVLLSLWAYILILGFGFLHRGAETLSEGPKNLLTNLYYSGTSFFTIGLGDVRPVTPFGRFLTVAEGGTGLGFLALVIGYLPGLNQSFSKREINISLLDARAGSPPTAAEMLYRRHGDDSMESIREFLHEWERWSAELLESNLSYPVLAYWRSQHDNQSWLAALTALLDTTAFVMVGVDGACVRQARLTFAMARHAAVDLSLIYGATPRRPGRDRLPPEQLAHLRERLKTVGFSPLLSDEADRKLMELRGLYEPFLFGLSTYFRLSIPPWIGEAPATDNWQESISIPDQGAKKAILRRIAEGHF